MSSSEIQKFKSISKLRQSSPEQLSSEWFNIRFTSCNSSMYDAVFNLYNKRNTCLIHASNKYKSPSTFITSVGTNFESISNYLFSKTTGFEIFPLGSIPHPLYSRIRGSVDGYGLNSDNKLFVLETKTPYSRIPSSSLTNITYMYQIIQNMEIINADIAYYNDVRLLPCSDSEITDPLYGREINNGSLTTCTFQRFNLAVEKKDPINLICCMVKRRYYDKNGNEIKNFDLEFTEDEWQGNIFNFYNEDSNSNEMFNIKAIEDIEFNKKMTKEEFINLMIDRKLQFIPINFTRKIGEDTRKWIEENYKNCLNDYTSIGCAFFKVDVHNIQKLYRPRGFWDKYLKPQALKWIEDLDKISNGEKIQSIPFTNTFQLKWPEQLFRSNE